MLKIKNEQHLVSLMLATLPEVREKTVSVVADKDVIVKVMRECLLHNLIEVGFIDIDPFEYDREYMLTLTYVEDEDCIEVDIDKIYLYDKDVYCATDGYILFHEDVNSKAQIDMEENEHVEFESDWFTFDETVESVELECEDCYECDCHVGDCCSQCDCKEETKPTITTATYTVNGRPVNKEEFDECEKVFREKMREIEDEMNAIKQLFRW